MERYKAHGGVHEYPRHKDQDTGNTNKRKTKHHGTAGAAITNSITEEGHRPHASQTETMEERAPGTTSSPSTAASTDFMKDGCVWTVFGFPKTSNLRYKRGQKDMLNEII